MKLESPEEKRALGRLIIGVFYCIYRGILHVFRIKPYDEE